MVVFLEPKSDQFPALVIAELLVIIYKVILEHIIMDRALSSTYVDF